MKPLDKSWSDFWNWGGTEKGHCIARGVSGIALLVRSLLAPAPSL